MMKKNFLDLDKKFSDFEKSKIVIVPFGLEKSTSYSRGTRNGPNAIIKASQEVELFDEEAEKEIFREIGIATLKIKPQREINKALGQLSEIVSHIYELNKIPIVLGGEHTLTIGSFGATLKKYPASDGTSKNLTLLQFDAHADLRDSLDGDKNSHAAAMRRCLEISNNFNLVQIGIRNISNEEKDGREYKFWKDNQHRLKTFWAREMNLWQLEEIINSCRENIYLTFDVDVFDSGLMPSSSTPEPGGLNWYQILDILKVVCQKRKIVGADFVEFCPIKGIVAPDFLVAKLIYKFISYLVNTTNN